MDERGPGEGEGRAGRRVGPERVRSCFVGRPRGRAPFGVVNSNIHSANVHRTPVCRSRLLGAGPIWAKHGDGARKGGYGKVLVGRRETQSRLFLPLLLCMHGV